MTLHPNNVERAMYTELKVFGGRAHPALTNEICNYLGMVPGQVTAYNFADGEIFCQIQENVRYARQDKKDKPRVPITAKLVADVMTAAGADRLLTMDVHAQQISGYFDIPVDHLFAAPVLLDAIRALGIEDLMIVAPDAGGVARARAIAKRLHTELAIIDKRRVAANQAEVMNVIGDVKGRDVLILDDIIDTAGTLINSVESLAAQGARRIFAAGIHGVLSASAIERIEESKLEGVLVTNTTPLEEKLARSTRLRPHSVAALLGEAIRRIHDNSSVTSLFV